MAVATPAARACPHPHNAHTLGTGSAGRSVCRTGSRTARHGHGRGGGSRRTAVLQQTQQLRLRFGLQRVHLHSDSACARFQCNGVTSRRGQREDQHPRARTDARAERIPNPAPSAQRWCVHSSLRHSSAASSPSQESCFRQPCTACGQCTLRTRACLEWRGVADEVEHAPYQCRGVYPS